MQPNFSDSNVRRSLIEQQHWINLNLNHVWHLVFAHYLWSQFQMIISSIKATCIWECPRMVWQILGVKAPRVYCFAWSSPYSLMLPHSLNFLRGPAVEQDCKLKRKRILRNHNIRGKKQTLRRRKLPCARQNAVNRERSQIGLFP